MGCPTRCDDDCETLCHEAHQVPEKRDHNVYECEGRTGIQLLQFQTAAWLDG